MRFLWSAVGVVMAAWPVVRVGGADPWPLNRLHPPARPRMVEALVGIVACVLLVAAWDRARVHRAWAEFARIAWRDPMGTDAPTDIAAGVDLSDRV